MQKVEASILQSEKKQVLSRAVFVLFPVSSVLFVENESPTFTTTTMCALSLVCLSFSLPGSYVWEHLEMGYIQGMCDLLAPLMVILDDGEQLQQQNACFHFCDSIYSRTNIQ